jgi:hypothetical protein
VTTKGREDVPGTDFQDRVKKAFSDERTREYGDDYLEHIRDTWRQVDVRLTRSRIIFLVLIAVFLLFGQAVEAVSLGPLKISDVSVVYKLLPAAIAFYCFNLWSLTANTNDLVILHHEVMRSIRKPLVDNQLEGYLFPHWGIIYYKPILETGGAGSRLATGCLRGWLIMSVYLLLPLVFEVYAFFRLFSQYGIADLLVWISLVISIYFLAQTWFVVRNLFATSRWAAAQRFNEAREAAGEPRPDDE